MSLLFSYVADVYIELFFPSKFPFSFDNLYLPELKELYVLRLVRPRPHARRWWMALYSRWSLYIQYCLVYGHLSNDLWKDAAPKLTYRKELADDGWYWFAAALCCLLTLHGICQGNGTWNRPHCYKRTRKRTIKYKFAPPHAIIAFVSWRGP